MRFARRLILHAPPPEAPSIAAFVEACVADEVALICCVGPHCRCVEETIDELVVGDGSDDGRVITTTSHPNDTIEEVRSFAAAWTLGVDPNEPIQEVCLSSGSISCGRSTNALA